MYILYIYPYVHWQFLSFSPCGSYSFWLCLRWAIKLLEFSWTENSLWRKSLSGSVYSSRNMKNRSARPWAQIQVLPTYLPFSPFFLAHCAFGHFLGRLFYEIFIDELWFLFAALHVTLYAAIFIFCRSLSILHMYISLLFLFFVGKFNYFKMICAHINKK